MFSHCHLLGEVIGVSPFVPWSCPEALRTLVLYGGHHFSTSFSPASLSSKKSVPYISSPHPFFEGNEMDLWVLLNFIQV